VNSHAAIETNLIVKCATVQFTLVHRKTDFAKISKNLTRYRFENNFVRS